MNKNEIKNKLKDFTQKPVFPKMLIAAGLLIMMLIIFSDSFDKKEEDGISRINADFSTSDKYSQEAEERLSEILSSIEGVGKVKVLINIISTEEYVYAEEYRQSTGSTENEIVIIDEGSSKEALVRKVKIPEVGGIVIVCEGGDDPKVCEKVYQAVSTALKIPSNRIYVAEMK